METPAEDDWEFPHLVFWFISATNFASTFVQRRPVVHAYGKGRLGAQLAEVNVFAPTRMCRTMTKYGSDKGRLWPTTIYTMPLRGSDQKPLRIFELGLGSNNPHLVSSMGSTGRPGASLRGWKELFPYATVSGADIDRAALFQEDRIKTFYCDQLDPAAISVLWSQPELEGEMDIIIEDGLHTFEANVCFLEHSLARLKPGGLYVVEDIETAAISRWQHSLSTEYAPRYPNHDFALLVLPNSANVQDNNMLVVQAPR